MYPINEFGGIKNQSHSYYGFLEGLFCVTRPIEAHHGARTTSCNFDAFALRRREAAYICVFREASTFIFDPPLAEFTSRHVWFVLDCTIFPNYRVSHA